VDPVYSQYVGATPIGITDEFLGEDRNAADFTTSQFDPQITFRYRPSENLSLYAKYAEAFKSGSFEIELKSTPAPEEFVFDNEYSESYEVGLKGTFLDGRARASVAIFDTTINDLQVGTTLPLAVVNATGQASATVNAAAQSVKGIEFDTVYAVNERLTLGLTGALYDGDMESFENAGCTTYESENADTGPCISEDESIALVGDDSLENTIDRTGQPTPRTPQWVYILRADYAAPIGSRYELSVNGRFKSSDGYLTNIETFDRVVTMPQHNDLNLLVGFGDVDGVWRVALYGRNLLEPIKEYNPEFDLRPDAFVNTALPQSSFRTYGVQFRYNYN
jgi:iron complex outermembrane receptor protein